MYKNTDYCLNSTLKHVMGNINYSSNNIIIIIIVEFVDWQDLLLEKKLG